MLTLEQKLYEYLRHGDDHTPDPQGLNMDLGPKEHAYLAKYLSAWLKRNYKIEPK